MLESLVSTHRKGVPGRPQGNLVSVASRVSLGTPSPLTHSLMSPGFAENKGCRHPSLPSSQANLFLPFLLLSVLQQGRNPGGDGFCLVPVRGEVFYPSSEAAILTLMG